METELELSTRLIREAVRLIDETGRLALSGVAPLDAGYLPLADEAFQAATALLRTLIGPESELAAALTAVVESVNLWSRESWTDCYVPLGGGVAGRSDRSPG